MSTREKASLDMMQSPDDWPYWPVLPLKRSSRDNPGKDTGVLFNGSIADDTVEPVIYLVNLWRLSSLQVLQNAEKITYTDLQAIVDDGWVVD